MVSAPSPLRQPLVFLRRHPGWVGMSLLLALVSWWGWKPEPTEAPAGGRAAYRAGPVPVRVVEAEQGALPVYLHALGTVTPLSSVVVRSRVDGELIQVAFEEGQYVNEGDLLARIDPRSYEVALMEAEGQQLQNRALLDNARSNLALYQGLWEQDSIARQELDNQEALVRQYEGLAKIDQARVEEARLQLSYTRIIAPVSGRLGLRQVDPGNLVSRNDSEGLVTITQMAPVSVLFHLPEADLPALLARLRAGGVLTAEAWNRTHTELLATGQLHTLDSQIDPTTGTIALKAHFDNEPMTLFPNQFVNTRLHLDTVQDAVLIPSAAVQYGAPGTYVYIVDKEQKAQLRIIREGPSSGQLTAVMEGLQPGEQVVLEGIDRLRAGAQVEIVPAPLAEGVEELQTVQVPAA